jgi:nucleoside phosphorylase
MSVAVTDALLRSPIVWGQAEAARLAERLLVYEPTVLVNLGIAGSLHSEVRTGDVVVPDLVFAYDKTAKAVEKEGSAGSSLGQWEWIRRGDAYRCSHALITDGSPARPSRIPNGTSRT